MKPWPLRWKLALYAAAFEAAGALDKLEGFASLHGPAFYRLPVNQGTGDQPMPLRPRSGREQCAHGRGLP